MSSFQFTIEIRGELDAPTPEAVSAQLRRGLNIPIWLWDAMYHGNKGFTIAVTEDPMDRLKRITEKP